MNCVTIKEWVLPKAITILAASELGKRRKEEEGKERKVILSSRDVYQYFYPLMCDLPTEEMLGLVVESSFQSN